MLKAKKIHESLKNGLTQKTMHDKIGAHIFSDDEEETAGETASEGAMVEGSCVDTRHGRL